MVGTLWHLAVATAVFVAVHAVSGTPLRMQAVAAMGERVWTGVFSLVSLLLFAWMIWAYGEAPTVVLWQSTVWTRWIPLLVMPVAFVLLIAGYATPNPTAVMSERVLASSEPAQGVLKVTRHPLMWSIALWALSHIPANGDAASLILMGSVALLALAGMRTIDAKVRRRDPEGWARLAAVTSAIPFVALAQGRCRLTLGEIGWVRIGAGLVLYALFLYLHSRVIGVSPWPAG